jgi:hypothetical protein
MAALVILAFDTVTPPAGDRPGAPQFRPDAGQGR